MTDPRPGAGGPYGARPGRRSVLRFLPVLLVLLVSYLLLSVELPPREGSDLAPNVLVFSLVNLNISVVLVLVVIVGRNLVKLAFDRRRNLLGSKLRMRLVAAFVSLMLLPTATLFVLASGFLNRAMEGWFSSELEASRDAAGTISRYLFASAEAEVTADAEKAAAALAARDGAPFPADRRDVRLDRVRRETGLFSVRVFDHTGAVLLASEHVAADLDTFREPEPDAGVLRKARSGGSEVLLEREGAGVFVRHYGGYRRGAKSYAVVSSLRLDPEAAEAFSLIQDSAREYAQLKLLRNPLRSGYLLTFSLVTCMILFAAVWMSFYIARQITGPIEAIARGTEAVARGDYDVRVDAGGDDEIGMLVGSFNKMTADLKTSRDEATRRRLFIETVLGNLAVGVIVLDEGGRVTVMNRAASELFGAEAPPGAALSSVLGGGEAEAAVRRLLAAAADAGGPAAAESEFVLAAQGREARVVCTVGTVPDPSGTGTGTVLLFDDVTELAKAQAMSAWREVARRIAHEIKNPLTPIQLNAQRLERRFAGDDAAEDVREAAATIVENVASIKRLANEFSNFARMPTAEPVPVDPNVLVSEVLDRFADGHDDVTFQFLPAAGAPEVMLDPEQMRRVLYNLLDNAAAAVRGRPERGKVVVRTIVDARRSRVGIEVSDNGPGVTKGDKARVFEPYFTTKPGGTGLGLAVCTSIVADHGGTLRVLDNVPRGARFVIDLPVGGALPTGRQFA